MFEQYLMKQNIKYVDKVITMEINFINNPKNYWIIFQRKKTLNMLLK